MEKNISELVYEMASRMYVRELIKTNKTMNDYECEHLANYFIERARVFVGVAQERGLVKTPKGLFNDDTN